MIKSEVHKSSVSVKCKYPYLGIFPSGMVILFYDVRIGTVVVKGDSVYSIGFSNDNWPEESCTHLIGSVTLSND